jgi:hypothetical protein
MLVPLGLIHYAWPSNSWTVTRKLCQRSTVESKSFVCFFFFASGVIIACDVVNRFITTMLQHRRSLFGLISGLNSHLCLHDINLFPKRQLSASHAGRFISWTRVTDRTLEGGQGQCRRFVEEKNCVLLWIDPTFLGTLIQPDQIKIEIARNSQLHSQNCGNHLTSGRIRSKGDQFTTGQAQPKRTR